MADIDWFRHYHGRAPAGGEEVFGHFFKGGEFEPFFVPRPVMPQIDEADLPELIEFIDRKGVEVLRKTIAPRELRAHQRIQMPHVMEMDDTVLAKPALTSLDRYVLDGNHRWWGHVLKGSEMDVFEIQAGFTQSMELLFAFPKTYAYGDGAFHPVRN